MRFVIDWNRSAKLLHGFAEAQQLITRVLRILTRHWQMSRNAVNPDIRKCGDPFDNVQGFAFWNSHAAHARIDLEIDGYWRAVRYPIEIFRFFERRNCGNETALGNCRSLPRQGGTKDNDRMGKRFPKCQCLFQIGDAKKLHLIREDFRHAD